MTAIGIDVGTSAIKAVSENNKTSFPSCYLYIDNQNGQVIEYVGAEALKNSIKDGAVFSWPVVKGRFTNYEREATVLVSSAIRTVLNKKSEEEFSDVDLAIGLPNLAMEDAQALTEFLQKEIQIGKVAVYHQTLGTLVDENATTGIVVSLGHGTTEIMAFVDLEYVTGFSWEQAADKILESLGDMFWDTDYIKENEDQIQPLVKAYATELANKIQQFQGKLMGRIKDPRMKEKMGIIVTGGGIMIPGLEKELRAKLGDSFTIAKDPIYSNAKGLQKIAKSVHGSKK